MKIYNERMRFELIRRYTSWWWGVSIVPSNSAVVSFAVSRLALLYFQHTGALPGDAEYMGKMWGWATFTLLTFWWFNGWLFISKGLSKTLESAIGNGTEADYFERLKKRNARPKMSKKPQLLNWDNFALGLMYPQLVLVFKWGCVKKGSLTHAWRKKHAKFFKREDYDDFVHLLLTSQVRMADGKLYPLARKESTKENAPWYLTEEGILIIAITAKKNKVPGAGHWTRAYRMPASKTDTPPPLDAGVTE